MPAEVTQAQNNTTVTLNSGNGEPGGRGASGILKLNWNQLVITDNNGVIVSDPYVDIAAYTAPSPPCTYPDLIYQGQCMTPPKCSELDPENPDPLASSCTQ